MMVSETVEIITTHWEETFKIGQVLAPLLYSGDILALTGNLGSGKTVFTKGVCQGLEVTEIVTSPTFTLVQEYTGRLPVYHFDFYRLTSLEEIEMLDLDGYFNMGGISIIEWAERGISLLPSSIFKIEIERNAENLHNPDQRQLKITGPADRGLERIKV